MPAMIGSPSSGCIPTSEEAIAAPRRGWRSISSGEVTLRQAGALGLLAVYDLAELDIRPEAARAQRALEASRRIRAQLFRASFEFLHRFRPRTGG